MTRPASPGRAVVSPALAPRRPVPPLDPAVRADLVRLLADALVLRVRERASAMGATPRGPNHPSAANKTGTDGGGPSHHSPVA